MVPYSEGPAMSLRWQSTPCGTSNAIVVKRSHTESAKVTAAAQSVCFHHGVRAKSEFRHLYTSATLITLATKVSVAARHRVFVKVATSALRLALQRR